MVENTVYEKDLLAEHGLSLYIEFNNKNYLFDSGQGLVLEHNAEQLDIDLTELDALILSHGHYDHTGGVQRLLELNEDLDIYAHPDFKIERFSKKRQRLVPVSYQGPEIKNLHKIKSDREIAKNLFLTGEIKAAKDYLNNKYQQKVKGKLGVDKFNDDISLFVQSEQGLVIILGCSHKGIINIVEEIIKKSGENKIDKIIGGMHLKNADDEKLQNIANYFQTININSIYPLHCSGKKASYFLKERLGDKIKFAGVGDSI